MWIETDAHHLHMGNHQTLLHDLHEQQFKYSWNVEQGYC